MIMSFKFLLLLSTHIYIVYYLQHCFPQETNKYSYFVIQGNGSVRAIFVTHAANKQPISVPTVQTLSATHMLRRAWKNKMAAVFAWSMTRMTTKKRPTGPKKPQKLLRDHQIKRKNQGKLLEGSRSQRSHQRLNPKQPITIQQCPRPMRRWRSTCPCRPRKNGRAGGVGIIVRRDGLGPLPLRAQQRKWKANLKRTRKISLCPI